MYRLKLSTHPDLETDRVPENPSILLQRSDFTSKDILMVGPVNIETQLLLDLGADTEPLSKAQGSVLLSYHVDPDHSQAGDLWLAIAIQNALIIGKQPTMHPYILGDEGSTKRLWWSILIRDRCICLGQRRQTLLTSTRFTDENFSFRDVDFANEIDGSKVYDKVSKRLLFENLRQQCKLATLATDIVTSMFQPHRLHHCEALKIANTYSKS
ncbi:hypothetical protein BJX99DRAFT_262282 [Aspergillus californicus]